jgi:hypothetical protein
LYGTEFSSVEATTSSADEGEEGKVHLLHDLVFREGAPRDVATGVFVHAARGDSLDVGMLHTPQNKSRRKCTIEFWYHIPQAHLVVDEIILARRSLFFEDNEPSQLCLPDEKHNTLWELALLPTGLLELKTNHQMESYHGRRRMEEVDGIMYVSYFHRSHLLLLSSLHLSS